MSFDMSNRVARKARAFCLTSAAVMVALHATGALAQEGTRLPTIYYTASLSPVEAGRTGVSASVLTQDALAGSAIRSLPLFLSSQAGVSATQNGGLGTTGSVRLRGLGGGYLATRLDGIDVTDPTGTQISFNFGQVTTLGLDRVEIVRGSQSALHGSEAIGGLITLSTFRPTRDGLSGATQMEVGSFDTASAATSIGYRDAGTEAAVTIARTISEGFSTLSNNDEADGFDGTFLSYHLARDITDTLRVGVTGHLRDNWAEFDESSLATGSFEEAETRAHRLFVAADLGMTSHELAYSKADFDRVSTSGLWGATPFDGARAEWLYTGHWAGTGDLALNWGLESSEESYLGAYDGGASTTNAAFGEAMWAANDALDLSFAWRLTDHDSFGSHNTWRVAAAYRASEALTLRGVAATGFTAPSPYQRFSDSGHDGLTPETSESVEIGADYAFAGGATVSATVFDTTVSDRIDYVNGAGPCASSWGCYRQIPGETRSQGIELSASLPLGAAWVLDAITPIPKPKPTMTSPCRACRSRPSIWA